MAYEERFYFVIRLERRGRMPADGKNVSPGMRLDGSLFGKTGGDKRKAAP